ncbi:MAG: hypothetical protein AAGC55_12790, partial [Myxococcota bacterium]
GQSSDLGPALWSIGPVGQKLERRATHFGIAVLASAAVAAEPEPVVVLAAAQVVCGDLAGAERAASAPLDGAALVRLRALLGDTSLPPAALLDSARCLVEDGSEASLRAVQTLRARGPRALRRPLERLLRSAAAAER